MFDESILRMTATAYSKLMIAFGIFWGCADRLDLESGAARYATRVYGARVESVDVQTKAERIFGNDILWTDGDSVYYYLYNGTYTGLSSTSASGDGQETRLSVLYDKTRNDTGIYAVYKGVGLGSITRGDSTILVTDGIPATQTGEFEPYMLSRAVEDFDVQYLNFSPQQAFITFSILAKSIRKSETEILNFSKIVISDNNPTVASRIPIAGNAIFPMSVTGADDRISIVRDGSESSTITCPVLSGDEVQYYIAIRPGTYVNG